MTRREEIEKIASDGIGTCGKVLYSTVRLLRLRTPPQDDSTHPIQQTIALKHSTYSTLDLRTPCPSSAIPHRPLFLSFIFLYPGSTILFPFFSSSRCVLRTRQKKPKKWS